MEMVTFSIITGTITVIGFFLQVRDMFPRYRQYYAAATFILLGLTIGVAIAPISGMTIRLPKTLTPRNIVGLALFGGSGILVSWCFIAVTFIKNKDRRSELARAGSAVSGFLIFLLIFFTDVFFPASQRVDDLLDRLDFTYDERIHCALNAVDQSNYERALTILADAKGTLSFDDMRYQNLTTLIDDIRTKQASIPTSASRALETDSE